MDDKGSKSLKLLKGSSQSYKEVKYLQALIRVELQKLIGNTPNSPIACNNAWVNCAGNTYKDCC